MILRTRRLINRLKMLIGFKFEVTCVIRALRLFVVPVVCGWIVREEIKLLSTSNFLEIFWYSARNVMSIETDILMAIFERNRLALDKRLIVVILKLMLVRLWIISTFRWLCYSLFLLFIA
jgi:hypothetical protein